MKLFDNSYYYFNSKDVEKILNLDLSSNIDLAVNSFIEYHRGNVILPEKTSQILNEEFQNRINCLPGTLTEKKVSGIKWVSVFPSNDKNLRNLTGLLILSDTTNGYPLAVMDASYLTAVRTASVGALAAKFLSKANSETIGFIGSGEQAKMHFKMIMCVRDLKTCYISSKSNSSELNMIDELKKDYPSVNFIPCSGDHSMASINSDIIVTAVSAQAPLLKEKYIKKGATYIHVGGWEDEYAVAEKADKIICDNWESVKHRSQTLSLMYKEGLISDEDIFANLDEVIVGEKKGRENDEEFIYFNSVGLAHIDLMFGYSILEVGKEMGLGIILEL